MFYRLSKEKQEQIAYFLWEAASTKAPKDRI